MIINENGISRKMTEEEIAEKQRVQAEFEKTDKYKAMKLFELKSELATYDYIGVKIAMGVATIEEYAEQIAYTERLREEIRKLEEIIESEEDI